MILSLNHQAVLFLTTAAAGFLLGLLYDAVRIFRQIFPHKNALIQIEDALYWGVVILLMFVFMLHENYGEIRFFSILGAFLGMGLYFLSLSRLILSVSDFIIHIIKSVLLLFFTIVSTPFRLLYLIFRVPVRKSRTFFMKKARKLLQFSRRYAKIKRAQAKRSFQIISKKH